MAKCVRRDSLVSLTVCLLARFSDASSGSIPNITNTLQWFHGYECARSRPATLGCSCGWSFFRSFHSWLLRQDDDQIEAHQLHSKEEEGYKAACSVTSSRTLVVACRWSICRAVSRGPSVRRGDRSWTTSHCVTETVVIAAAVHLKRKIWGELLLKQRGWSSSQMGSLRGLSWSHGVTVIVMVAMTILLHHHHVVQAQDIFVGFYDQTCPSAESIVTEVVKEATAKDPTVPAAMIRLLFHDCFVQVY